MWRRQGGGMNLDPMIRRLRSFLAIGIAFASLCGVYPLLRACPNVPLALIVGAVVIEAVPFIVVLVAGHNPWVFGIMGACTIPLSIVVRGGELAGGAVVYGGLSVIFSFVGIAAADAINQTL